MASGEQSDFEPLYLLYYEETHFQSSAHYQSVRPLTSTTPFSVPLYNATMEMPEHASSLPPSKSHRDVLGSIPNATAEMPEPQAHSTQQFCSMNRSDISTTNIISGSRRRRQNQ